MRYDVEILSWRGGSKRMVLIRNLMIILNEQRMRQLYTKAIFEIVLINK